MTNLEEGKEPQNPQVKVSVGLLDLAYWTPEEVYWLVAAGNLLCSLMAVRIWQKDEAIGECPI